MQILIPDTIPLTLTSPGDTFVVYDATAPFDARHAAAEMLVTWGNTNANMQSATQQLPQLRLVQTLSAGPDQAVAAGFAPHILICSGRSLHDGPVTEHTLALILALQRRIPELHEAQKRHEWVGSMVPAQAAAETRQEYTLAGATVVILGFGSIAATLTPVLRALGAHVIGVATRADERAGTQVVAWSDRATALARADVVVSILPHTTVTDKICDAAFFALLKSTAIFVNVGRGKTVDENAIVAALRAGQFRAAALDVTAIEPLPVDAALWECPNLLLTPHVAGGRPINAAALVLAQIAAYKAGQPLQNLVSR
jgi:phosphoglycerate dehydrogenase-like enzyme